MHGFDLQGILQQVGEDDLKRAAAKAEAEREAHKQLRLKQGGMNISELMTAISLEDDEPAQKEIPSLHEKEQQNVQRPKAAGSGFFPPPPGK